MALSLSTRYQDFEMPAKTRSNLRSTAELSGWINQVQARVQDPERLAALRATGLLDSPREEAFDRFVRVASRLANGPVAAVVLIDQHRQFFKSALGMPEVVLQARGTPMAYSFCQHVIALREPLIIEDTRVHTLVWNNPAVTEGIHAYIGVPLTLPDGNIIGTLCVMDYKPRPWEQGVVETLQELAEMTMTEIALRKNVEEFRGLAEAMPQIVWITRPDGRSTYFNHQWMDYTGLTLEKSVEGGWGMALHPEDRTQAAQHWKKALESGENYETEYRLRRADGTYHWMLGRALPLLDKSGKIIKWFGTSTDIHQVKMSELEVSRTNLALLAAEEKYRSIFENSNEGIYQSQPDGGILSANPALATILGFDTPEELIHLRTNIGEQGFVQPEIRQEFMSLLESQGRVTGFEYEVYRKDGQRIWVSESAHIARDEKSGALYYEGSMHDITERKLSEARLADLHRQFVDISRQAGMAEVATSVLHNVGNVLNSANISLEVATSKMLDLSVEGVEVVADLLESHKQDLPDFLCTHPQGKQVTFYLSQLARHYKGQQKQILEEFRALRTHIDHISDIVSRQQSYATVCCVRDLASINDIVADALCMNNSALEGSHVKITRDFDLRIPWLPMDRHKIMQILVNLIRNALNATSENDPADRRIIVQTRFENNSLLQIGIADNGVGIERKNLKHVFEFGFTTRKTGHGFGLHSCATNAQEMGGTLRVGSAGVDQGAIFTLELPITPLPTE